jgi:hypothetical protein
MRVIVPPVGFEVCNVPPVTEIPWQPPVPLPPVAVIAIVFPAAEAAKFALVKKPTPDAPVPWIREVAVMFPAVPKEEATLIPFPPPVPPEQCVNVTGPLPAKLEAKVTPWLVDPAPPEQFEKVRSPPFPEVHVLVSTERP